MANQNGTIAPVPIYIDWIALDDSGQYDLRFRFALKHDILLELPGCETPVRIEAGRIFHFPTDSLGYYGAHQAELRFNQAMEKAGLEVLKELSLPLAAVDEMEVPF